MAKGNNGLWGPPASFSLIEGTVPYIITQPVPQSVPIASNAVFNVTAGGTTPLAYQWLRNNSALFGSTNTILALATVTTNNTGAYQVVITNVFGSVTSGVANLRVLVPAGFINLLQAGQGKVILSFLGSAFNNYVVWATTNLTPPVIWQPIYTNTIATNGVWSFTDTNATAFHVRFFSVTPQ